MITRKSAFDPKETKAQQTYIDGCDALNKSGEYTKFVNWHAAMGRYRMHSMGFEGKVGLWRFLAWHRIYLLEFEKALRKHQPTAYIPYWKWTENKIPAWIIKYTPSVHGVTRLDPSSDIRDFNPTFLPPSSQTAIRRPSLNGYTVNQQQIDRILAETTFEDFSFSLERGPHNRLHSAIGGVMNSEVSPADPMFWLHHANVDRLWALWQSRNVSNNKRLPEITHPDDTLPQAQQDAFVAQWSNLTPFNVPVTTATQPTTLLGYQYG